MITIEMMGVRMGIETIINFGHIAVGRALPAVSFLIGGYHSPNRSPHFNPMDDMRGENKKNWAKSNICIIIQPFMASVKSFRIMNINSSHTIYFIFLIYKWILLIEKVI